MGKYEMRKNCNAVGIFSLYVVIAESWDLWFINDVGTDLEFSWCPNYFTNKCKFSTINFLRRYDVVVLKWCHGCMGRRSKIMWRQYLVMETVTMWGLYVVLKLRDFIYRLTIARNYYQLQIVFISSGHPRQDGACPWNQAPRQRQRSPVSSEGPGCSCSACC